MTARNYRIAVVSLLAVAVAGLAAWLVRDSMVTNEEVTSIEAENTRIEKALDAARQEARQVVREKLRRDDAAAAKANAEAPATRRKAAQGRRAKAKRIFAARGFAASAGYLRSVAMPKGEPTAEDQEVIDLAGEAASEEDLDTAAEVLEAALRSPDPRARLAAVEMLDGFGDAGLVDLSELLRDPHPEVANLAADRLELGIQNLEDETEQAALVKVGYLAMTDADQLRALGGTLMLLNDTDLAVDVLTGVIQEGTQPQREAAKETYEILTGEKWKKK